MLLGYRISGSVPEIPEGARLRIDTDGLHLEWAEVPGCRTARWSPTG